MSDKPKLTKRQREILQDLADGTPRTLQDLRTTFRMMDALFAARFVNERYMGAFPFIYSVYTITAAGRAALAEASQ